MLNSGESAIKGWCLLLGSTSLQLQSARDISMFNTSFLFASLIWGSVGIGYFIYGKKQSSWPAMVGGVAMIAASYFVGSAWLMSALCLGLVAVVYFLLKQGY